VSSLSNFIRNYWRPRYAVALLFGWAITTGIFTFLQHNITDAAQTLTGARATVVALTMADSPQQRPTPSPREKPKPKRQQQQTIAVELPRLTLAAEGVRLNVATATKVEPLLELPPLDITLPAPPPQQQASQAQQQALSLDQLDHLPHLIALPTVPYPAALSQRNVARVLVKLDVFISEGGEVTLLGITENPYPDLLDATVRRLASAARFSPPLQHGKPARTRFIWPLEIKDEN
jgi:outer membrane biosynthesis protein TonB